MKQRRPAFRLPLAGALIVASIAIAVPLADAAQTDTWPANATRIATEDDYLPDIMTSLGLKPVASVSSPTSSGWLPSFQPFSKGVQSFGQTIGSADNFEALASAHPDAIIAPAFYQGTLGSKFSAIAPTIYYMQTPDPTVNATGQVVSDWKQWLYQVATQIGRVNQANQVVTNLATRAAAIRSQVAGKTLAYVRLLSSSTWNSANDYLPVVQIYVQDLGVKNFQLPSQDYAAGCGVTDTPPKACQSNALSLELLSTVNPADATMVQVNALNGNDIQTFESNPIFAAIPSVKTGHITQAAFFTRLGPLGVAYEYSGVVSAFKLKEYFSTIAGTTAARASVTFDPSSKNVCVAAAPARGAKPADPVALTIGAQPSAPTLTIAAKPRYAVIPSSDTSAGITTAPFTQYVSSACATATTRFATALTRTSSSIRVRLGEGSGVLKHGAPSISVNP